MTYRLTAWVAFVALFSAVSYAGRFLLEGDTPDDFLYRYESAIAGAIQFLFVLGIVLAIATGASKRELFALRRPTSWWRAAGLGVAILVAMMIIGVIVGQFLDPAEEQGLLPDRWEPERAAAFAVNALVIAGLAPIVEELTFRGLGFSLLERFGQPLAILAVGFAFALAHGLVEAFPLLFAFGVGLAYIRSETRSIYPCIVLHVLFNSFALLQALTLPDRA